MWLFVVPVRTFHLFKTQDDISFMGEGYITHVSDLRGYGNHMFKGPKDFDEIQNQDLNLQFSSFCSVDQ
jgi:hypothetical protein